MAYTEIDRPDLYFNTKLYTGNGSTQSISGVNFTPDWVWVKDRTGANSHEVQDVVRGAGLGLLPNGTSAELTGRTLYQFDSDGFSLDGTNTTTNVNGDNYVAWNWLAGGTASSNTDGSITSQVSANTTSGFSIVSYTGNGTQDATIGHGLSSTPDMIIFKNRSITKSWRVWHSGLSGSTYYMNLDGTFAESSSSTVVNGQSSTTFTVGTDSSTNGSGNAHIAYCFAEKKGFSKFGSYTGNGSTDGTFVYTGFRPAFVMMKRTDSASNWVIFDTHRDPFNLSFKKITANTSNAEDTSGGNEIDILSNGFKTRSTNTDTNASGGTYIYMAFAENPLVTSSGVPATAR